LNRLKEEYLTPLRVRAQQGKPIISHARIALIFGNIEFILNLNTELLDKLKARIQVWSPTQVVGDIMIDAVESLLRSRSLSLSSFAHLCCFLFTLPITHSLTHSLTISFDVVKMK
jgi:hypothetical protein